MKMFLKTVFLLAVMGLLLLIGMHNRSPVDFSMPPVIRETLQKPAALMYLAFFGVGMLTGMIMMPSGRRRLPPIPGRAPEPTRVTL